MPGLATWFVRRFSNLLSYVLRLPDSAMSCGYLVTLSAVARPNVPVALPTKGEGGSQPEPEAGELFFAMPQVQRRVTGSSRTAIGNSFTSLIRSASPLRSPCWGD